MCIRDRDTTEFTEENALALSKSTAEGLFRFEDIRYGKYLIKELSCGEAVSYTHLDVYKRQAKVISLDPYRIEVFMQFGDIVVDYIYLDSEIWPLDGQEIRMEPDLSLIHI